MLLDPDPVVPGRVSCLGFHPRKHPFRCAQSLKKHLLRECPAIVQVHSFFSLLMVRSAFPFGRPFALVGTLHNQGYDAWPADTGYKRFRKWVHGRLLKQCDRVVSVSRAVADHYSRELGVRSQHIIPDPLPALAGLMKLHEIGAACKQRRRVIAIPGRVVREKGHFHAIQAFKALVSTGHDLELHVLGGGPLEADFSKEVTRLGLDVRVVCSGSLEHSTLLERLAAADVCLIPSLQEGFGIVALEAMALGVPVVASRVGGLAEIVQDGVTGLLAPPGEATLLAETVERLLTQPELAEDMSRAAKLDVHKRFSAESVSEQWLALFHELRPGL